MKSVKFGFNTVNSSVRKVVVAPQMIACSTQGKFRLTPAVTRALGVKHGDYLTFLSNVDEVDAAYSAQHPDIMAWLDEAGLDYGTPEAIIAVHKEMDEYAICAGIQEFDAIGNPKKITQRLTKADKIKTATYKFEELLAAAEQQASDEVKEVLFADDVTKEEQIEILAQFVTGEELDKYRGSKLAQTSGIVGTGLTLECTDSNMWNQLKVDLGANAADVNRVFDVDMDNVLTLTINNGYEDVEVKALTLTSYVDESPARRGE